MIKKYVAYNPETLEIIGVYNEGRKDLPSTVAEVNHETFLEDKGQHTHYSPNEGFHTIEPILTDVELRAKFKNNRTIQLRNLKVTVNNLEFNADEVSRGRMADAIVGLAEGEIQMWVLADNSVENLTKDQLIAVLREIGIAQTAIWTQ